MLTSSLLSASLMASLIACSLSASLIASLMASLIATSRSPSGINDRLPDRLCSQVEITMPDPKDHPDAYDAKGNLVDMYKDPDMMLGFAERVCCFPDPG